MKFLYLLLLRGGSIDSLVETLFCLVVAVFVKPDAFCGEADQSTHVGTEGGG